MVPSENKNNAYAKFGGTNNVQVAFLQGNKRILKWRPFWNKVCVVVITLNSVISRCCFVEYDIKIP